MAAFQILIYLFSFILISQSQFQRNFLKCLEFFPNGRSQRTFIIGGKKATISSFPHMAVLGYGSLSALQWNCGGTLISNKHILTAAHCTNDRELGPVLIVRLGSSSLNPTSGDHKDYKVKKIFVHENYKPPSQYNDIAILELSEEVEFSSNIVPACLHTSYKNTPKNLVALGWGNLEFSGPRSEDLMKVDLRVYDPLTCENSYQNVPKRRLSDGIRDQTQLCAGGEDQVKDTCQGDSGGPLEYKKGVFHYIVGVTSFGKACGIGSIPGVYTRVSAYINWIEKICWP